MTEHVVTTQVAYSSRILGGSYWPRAIPIPSITHTQPDPPIECGALTAVREIGIGTDAFTTYFDGTTHVHDWSVDGGVGYNREVTYALGDSNVAVYNLIYSTGGDTGKKLKLVLDVILSCDEE